MQSSKRQNEVKEVATTLQEAVKILESIKFKPKAKKEDISDKWLGKFRGIVLEGKTSTDYLKELRTTLHGKI